MKQYYLGSHYSRHFLRLLLERVPGGQGSHVTAPTPLIVFNGHRLHSDVPESRYLPLGQTSEIIGYNFRRLIFSSVIVFVGYNFRR